MVEQSIKPLPVIRQHKYHSVTTVTRSDDALAIATLNNASHIIAAAAWPIAVVVIARFFKNDISELMKRVREFSGLGLSANLDAMIQSLPPTPVLKEPTNLPAPTINIDASAVPPSAAETIEAAWSQVDTALNRFLQLDAAIARRTPIKSKVASLDINQQVPTSLKALVDDLLRIRNRVNHVVGSITADSLNLYVANANSAANQLEQFTPPS
jgi:hypothetical protein